MRNLATSFRYITLMLALAGCALMAADKPAKNSKTTNATAVMAVAAPAWAQPTSQVLPGGLIGSIPGYSCLDVYQPVCAKKGKITRTYGNGCYATLDGATILYSGVCGSPGGETKTNAGR